MNKLFLPIIFLASSGLSCLASIPTPQSSTPKGLNNPTKESKVEEEIKKPKLKWDNDITIINWNIEWFPGGKPYANREEIKNQIKRVKSTLKKEDPDILMAQEIRDWEAFSTICDAIPNMKPLAVSAFAREGKETYWPQQLAIGSELRTVAAWSETWKQGEKYRPRRGFTAATIRLPHSPYMLLIYTVHLKSNRIDDGQTSEDNQATRLESIKQIIDHVEYVENKLFKKKIAGVIIGGDFNTNNDNQWDDKVIETLEKAGFHNTWSKTPREERITWLGNTKHEPNCLDFIFTKNLGELSAQLLNTTRDDSDHKPIKLTIPTEVYKESIELLDYQNSLPEETEGSNDSQDSED